MGLNHEDIFEFLEEKTDKYNQPDFIENDPISIPHKFSTKEDIEISGFITAIISWGQRKTIINNGNKLIGIMGNSPFDYIMSTNFDIENEQINSFCHRTFNGIDCLYFFKALKNIYSNKGGLEAIFTNGYRSKSNNILETISLFKQVFFSISHPARTRKHISDPVKNSSAKRINMFLRWMVRKDKRGVDFGLWEEINQRDLLLPLDVHTGNVARKLGILKRKQNDAKAVIEVTNCLSNYCPFDPIKYDYALFGLGSMEKF